MKEQLELRVLARAMGRLLRRGKVFGRPGWTFRERRAHLVLWAMHVQMFGRPAKGGARG